MKPQTTPRTAVLGSESRVVSEEVVEETADLAEVDREEPVSMTEVESP